MSHARRVLLLLALLLPLAGGPALAQIVPGVTNKDWSQDQRLYTRDMLRDFNSLMQSWREAWQLGETRTVASFYSSDANVVLPGGERVQGRGEIQKLFETRMPAALEVRTGLNDFATGGRLAYATGPIYYRFRDENDEEQTVVGTFVTVMLREEGGWKIRSQVLSGVFAPAATEN